MSLKIKAIVGMDDNRVIGFENKLPWHIPEDMKNFKKLTTGHAVLMGRKTYDSLPEKFRPLPNRINYVASRGWECADQRVRVVNNPVQFLIDLKNKQEKLDFSELWVLGGQELYTLSMPYIDQLHVTRVPGVHQGDAFFPEFESSFKLVESVDGQGCKFERYVR